MPEEEGEPLHDFGEIIKEIFFLWTDLKDQLLPNSFMDPFADRRWSLP